MHLLQLTNFRNAIFTSALPTSSSFIFQNYLKQHVNVAINNLKMKTKGPNLIGSKISGMQTHRIQVHALNHCTQKYFMEHT